MEHKLIIEEIKKGISTNSLIHVLDEYLYSFEDTKYHDEILIHLGNLNQLEKEKRLGILSYEQENFRRNQISYSILNLLDQLTNDVKALSKFRSKEKGSLTLREEIIVVDLSELVGNTLIKEYRCILYDSAEDFLNDIYLSHLNGKVPPGTYELDWIFVDDFFDENIKKIKNDNLSSRAIAKIYNENTTSNHLKEWQINTIISHQLVGEVYYQAGDVHYLKGIKYSGTDKYIEFLCGRKEIYNQEIDCLIIKLYQLYKKIFPIENQSRNEKDIKFRGPAANLLMDYIEKSDIYKNDLISLKSNLEKKVSIFETMVLKSIEDITKK